MTRLEEIDAKKQRAEALSISKTGGSLGWIQYYGDDKDGDHETLRADFCYLRALIETMKDKTFDLECRAEAAGVSVE